MKDGAEASGRSELLRHLITSAGTARKSLTTGDVAMIFDVAPRTVSKWFDSGTLPGWRIPGSKDRRFNPGVIAAFAIKHNIPISVPMSVCTCGLTPYENALLANATSCQPLVIYDYNTLLTRIVELREKRGHVKLYMYVKDLATVTLAYQLYQLNVEVVCIVDPDYVPPANDLKYITRSRGKSTK